MYLFDFKVEENIDCIFTETSVGHGRLASWSYWQSYHLHLLFSQLCFLCEWDEGMQFSEFGPLLIINRTSPYLDGV